MTDWQFSPFYLNESEGTDKPTLILLSGWSLDASIFEPFLPALSKLFNLYFADLAHYSAGLSASAEQLVTIIEENFTQPVWLFGWSLGGNIAIEAASLKPSVFKGLILQSVTPCFLEREDWPFGVSDANFDTLTKKVAADPQKGLRYFDTLQSLNDASQKPLLQALKEWRLMQPINQSDLLKGLSWFEHLDQRVIFNQLRLPVLSLFGQEDSLIHQKSWGAIQALNPKTFVDVISDAAHAPFLTQPVVSFKRIEAFYQHYQKRQVKKAVAKQFSLAAEHYDNFSALQQKVGSMLLEKIDRENVTTLVDAGCGTGFFSEALSDHCTSLISVDLAQGMLDFARKHHTKAESIWLRADIEQLPLPAQSVDAIFSSLAVQWVDNLDAMLVNWKDILTPGGEALISTLGPRSLFELKKSFEAIDNDRHVNAFQSFDYLLACIKQSGFTLIDGIQKDEVIFYDSPLSLMKDLKGIGASFVERRSKGLMSKKRLSELNKAYSAFRLPDGQYPATYDVIYLHLKKR